MSEYITREEPSGWWSVVPTRGSDLHPYNYQKQDPGAIQAIADRCNALYAQGFRTRLRSDEVVFARELARHDGGEAGHIQVVEYHALDRAIEAVWIAVEVPRRDSIYGFALHEIQRYSVDESAGALALALDMVARGDVARGEDLTPERMLDIERSEGNPCADENWAARRSGRA